MKNTYLLISLFLLGLVTACKKDEETQPVTTTTTELVATINGAQQVPANNSTATGEFVGTYDASTMKLTYTVTYRGMTPNIAHIHLGAPGANGSVAIPFANLTSPITGIFDFTLSPSQATQLLNNGMYVNIHSDGQYSKGEIRGDIKKK